MHYRRTLAELETKANLYQQHLTDHYTVTRNGKVSLYGYDKPDGMTFGVVLA